MTGVQTCALSDLYHLLCTLAMASAVTSLANTGWLNVQSKWYYYDEAGNSVRNQWVENEKDLFWLIRISPFGS